MVVSLQCSWESPSVYCLTYRTDKDMERNYFKVHFLSNKLLVPDSDLKGVTFIATDKKKEQVMECRLLRIETVIVPRDNYEDSSARHTLVLNLAGKGIVRTQYGNEDYLFYKNEEDLVNNNRLSLAYSVKERLCQLKRLQKVFGKVTSFDVQSGCLSSNSYVQSYNYVWDSKKLSPVEVDCFMDASRIGISYGYDDDIRLFSLDGKPVDTPIIYCDSIEVWESKESALDCKVYLTKEECINDNSVSVIRFTPEEEAKIEQHWVELTMV